MGGTRHHGGPLGLRLQSAVSRWAAKAMASALPLLLALTIAPGSADAQETVCARVKIEIKQELTLERQAFDAEMKIHNTTDSSVIENVSVVVKVTDENGTPVAVTDDPNNLNAKFFVRLSQVQNIAAVDGTGSVNAKTTAVANWLLIPAPGSAGSSPLGKKYLVGATLKYRFGGEEQSLEVSPDVITVKPLPLLTLDYFLQQDVIGDDPLTPEIEAVEPATLGVRVRNTGLATAKSLKIDSAQPKIIENNQGLLINFKLTGSYVDDAPAQNTLLINFGDVAAGKSKMGRWLLETSLAGKFTEFTAKFSHADELGGALTSILQATNAHFLIRDVRVDLPGRDFVRDFLAQDGDVVRVYESDGPDTVVTDRSAVAQMVAGTNAAGNATYRITFPVTAGFVYLKLRDPFNGTKALGQIQRSDAKQMLSENVWLSKTRNLEAKRWEYWINVFDVNTTGVYDTEFQAPPTASLPPNVQFVPDRVVDEDKQVSFLVEASSPSGKPVTLSAAPLPAGATFTLQAADPQAPGVARALFDWKPAKGAAGSYLVTYTAHDGTLSGSRSASIKVNSSTPPPGPGTPAIHAPAVDGQVTSLRPTLGVLTSTGAGDPTTQVQFEIYADASMTQRIDGATVAKVPPAGEVAQPTSWQPAANLNDNTRYWWRARAYDGTQVYSPWANGRFFVNTFNDAPDSFNLTSPAAGAEVGTLQPVLSWTNSSDRDGDAITYGVSVYRDAALTDLLASVAELPGGAEGSTSWTVPAPLTNHVTYYWRVVARDALGAQTPGIARSFVVNTGNTPPTDPVIASPATGGESASATTTLTVHNGIDAENDLITYVFEIDTVNTFDSGDKRVSGPVLQSAASTTGWAVGSLVENRRYFWRVKSQDGRAESPWVMGSFLYSAVNDAPAAPTIRNPGSGAWSSTLQPVLEAHAVADPEGSSVRYQFEVYSDGQLSRRVAEGIAETTSFLLPTALSDKTTHWWRVRALDSLGAASAWSSAAVLYVSTGTYQDPSIQVTSPASPVAPDSVTTPTGTRKQVTLRWEGTDPNIEASVALYFDTSGSGFGGSAIVEGLRQPAGTHAGSHVWDVTDLSPGTYHVYGVIHDARGIGRAYAAGSVVIAPPVQSQIVVTAPPLLETVEGGTQSTEFAVRLASRPTQDVDVPVSTTNRQQALARPVDLSFPVLRFTPDNWSMDQRVEVWGMPRCLPEGDVAYQVQVGPATSADGSYNGLSAQPVNAINRETASARTTNNPSIHICRLPILSSQPAGGYWFDYTLQVELTNTGAGIGGGVVATLRPESLPFFASIVDGTASFGAVNAGEVSRSTDTLTLRALPPEFMTPMMWETLVLMLLKWQVTVSP